MKDKIELGDICAELDGVSALLCALGSPFQGGGNTLSDRTLGDAIFALQRYVERINDDVMKIESEVWPLMQKQ